MSHFIAVDLGAASGRVVLGRLGKGILEQVEVHRFDNVPIVDGEEGKGRTFWDIAAIERDIRRGIELAREAAGTAGVDGIGIDSWGVDYVLVGREGEPVAPPRHYRDRRTEGVMESVTGRIGREAIFRQTGVQFLTFNTIYQLASESADVLERSERLLMIADWFSRSLTGGDGACEVTLASTSQLLDARSRRWVPELADRLHLPHVDRSDNPLSSLEETACSPGEKLQGETESPIPLSPLEETACSPGEELQGETVSPIPLSPQRGGEGQGEGESKRARRALPFSLSELLPELVEAGTILGEYEGIPVIATASHDTAAAVVGCPGRGDDWAFLSSGTWSLLGVELAEPVITDEALEANFSNELGIAGTTRLLKNICGLWPLQECRRLWGDAGCNYSWSELIALAGKAPPHKAVIDPDDGRFLAPGNMLDEIAAACRESGQHPPESVGETVRVVVESLALKCRRVLELLEKVSGKSIGTINMVGGGVRNGLLCQLTADATGRRVVAGPTEATSTGNILTQAIGTGMIASLDEARDVIARSAELVEYEPNG